MANSWKSDAARLSVAFHPPTQDTKLSQEIVLRNKGVTFAYLKSILHILREIGDGGYTFKYNRPKLGLVIKVFGQWSSALEDKETMFSLLMIVNLVQLSI